MINGEFQESPVTMEFPCGKVQAVGETVVRQYDINWCIVAKKVFLFRYKGNVFGTTQFADKDQFFQYQKSNCACCQDEECITLLDGCIVTLKGCNVILT